MEPPIDGRLSDKETTVQYWKRLNPDGSTRTVESYSHHLDVKGAVEITKQEFDEFWALLPSPQPKQTPDLAIRVSNLEARVESLEERTTT